MWSRITGAIVAAGIGLAWLAISMQAAETPAGKPASRDGGPDMERASELIREATNAFRKENELGMLTANDELTETARYFAGYMARTDRYGHEADGKEPAERARERGYDYCIVLENIAYQFSSAGFATEELAGKFVDGWKRSPEHRKNMLDPDVSETGVAVARSPKTGRYYAVQMFGRSKSQSIGFGISNRSGAEVKYRVGEQEFALPPRYTRMHEMCRPEELRFAWEEGKARRPEGGVRYIIESGPEGEPVVREEVGS